MMIKKTDRQSGGGFSPAHAKYLKAIRTRRLLITAARALLLVAVLAAWELAVRAGKLDAFIVSSPTRVAKTVASLYKSGELTRHVLATFAECAAGFILGTAAGTLFAAALWFFPSARAVLDPYLVILNALPKIALGPVLIVWVGAGSGAIIVMALLVSTVVTVMTVLAGFEDVDPASCELMRTLGATRLQTFFKAVLPASVPAVMSALKISVGMSWVGVIVGEYLVSRQGLGYLIVYGGQVFRLDLVMASVAVLCVLAALMYYAVALLERLINRRFGRG